MSNVERRKSARVRCPGVAGSLGAMVDLSLGGLSFYSVKPPAIGSRWRTWLDLRRGERIPVALRIVHVGRSAASADLPQIGAAFVDLSEQSRADISAAINQLPPVAQGQPREKPSAAQPTPPDDPPTSSSSPSPVTETNVMTTPASATPETQCRRPECARPLKSRGLCDACYKAWRSGRHPEYEQYVLASQTNGRRAKAAGPKGRKLTPPPARPVPTVPPVAIISDERPRDQPVDLVGLIAPAEVVLRGDDISLVRGLVGVGLNNLIEATSDTADIRRFARLLDRLEGVV